MTEGCVFCKILNGDIPAYIIYRDAHTCLEELSGDEAAKHLAALPRIVAVVTDATDADGATVAWNNGPAAGQEVPHLHAHIVPRYAHDAIGPIHTMFKDRPRMSDTERKEIADRLHTALNH